MDKMISYCGAGKLEGNDQQGFHLALGQVMSLEVLEFLTSLPILIPAPQDVILLLLKNGAKVFKLN